jgi:hypothetical protein
MKKFISTFLLSCFLSSSLTAYAAPASANLNQLVQKYDFQLQARSLSAYQKSKVISSMKSDLNLYVESHSSLAILDDLNLLIKSMPEGSDKAKIVAIMEDNQNDPANAVSEIAQLNLLGVSQAGDSANWTSNVGDFLDKNIIIVIGVAVVGIVAAVVYTEKIKSDKNKVLDNQLNLRNSNGDTASGLSTSFYGTAEKSPVAYESCVLSNAEMSSSIDIATAMARASCSAESRVQQSDCTSNRPYISMKLVASTRCVVTASVSATILRVQ